MKILRFTYPPSGRSSLEEISLKSHRKDTTEEKVRIEICNIQGEFVYIFNDREKIKNLRLPEGFYFIREKDLNGNVLKTSKLVI
jgi:hypothetical protein